MPISLPEAEQAVRLARRAIEASLGPAPPRDAATPFRSVALPPLFEERRGVFVTLRRASDGALRGCIGYPRPVEPLRAAIPHVAAAAAFEDPRFRAVTTPELAELTVEVSVLTVPEAVPARDPRGRLAEVVVGRDGLIIEAHGASGLLLPQVATEEGWDSATFLAATCQKAGLPPDTWQDLRSRLYRFQAEVFAEVEPNGRVEAVPLTPARGALARRG